MTHTFLLEIGLEEMPARVVFPTVKQLKEKVATFLEEERLTYDMIKMYATPRRLAFEIVNLADKQTDISEKAKGPSKKIAQDAEGNWTKAAQGFARGQGVTPDDLYIEVVKGEEYVFVDKFIEGKAAREILPDIMTVVKKLHFPVTMHWGSHDFEYIRPVHWLVALLDDEVVNMSFLDVEAGRISRGHRFLGGEVSIASATDYVEALKKEYVIVDSEERMAMIRENIQALAKKHQWQIEQDKGLLEEVTNLVEYPTVFVGQFKPAYLEIPDIVLVTSMREHQRYFDVRDQNGALQPYFIGVRNGNNEHIDNVIAGNEKVLKARLEDADFFFKEDQAVAIETQVKKLKHVTFHEKIGTMEEKGHRVEAIAQLIAKEVGLSEAEQEDLRRASQIYKFDLMTNMVGEFPELQGIMGEKYALIQGESPAVATAIREHYLPTSSDGDLPQTDIGAVLAIADKLDTVMTFFKAGLFPTGSNDPYALRRQSYGIIRIIENKQWGYPLLHLHREIAKIINEDSSYYGVSLEDGDDKLVDFVKGRLKQFLASQEIRHDIIEAVVNGEQEDLLKMIEAARLLKDSQHREDFKPTIEALTRVMNLARKGQEMIAETLNEKVDPDLFENEHEASLYKAVEEMSDLEQSDMAERMTALRELAPIIEQYFAETMVMSDDEAVRNNRLRQLAKISDMILTIASIDLLLTK